MVHRIKSETDSGSGNYWYERLQKCLVFSLSLFLKRSLTILSIFSTLLVNILEGKRAGQGAPDEEKAKATAEMYVRHLS